MPPFSSYHSANAYQDGEGLLHVQVNVLNGSREGLEAQFSDMYGASFGPQHQNTLFDYVFDVPAGRLVSAAPLMPAGCGALPNEFPAVSPLKVGKRARYVYTTALGPAASGFFDSVQKLDTEAGSCQTRALGPGRHPQEITFVPAPGGGAEDAGWALFVVYDAARHGAEVHVVDAADFEGPPLCVLRLEHHLPYGFHGLWLSAAEVDALTPGGRRS